MKIIIDKGLPCESVWFEDMILSLKEKIKEESFRKNIISKYLRSFFQNKVLERRKREISNKRLFFFQLNLDLRSNSNRLKDERSYSLIF